MTTEIDALDKKVRVACDVGGTFTDICVLNEKSGLMHVAKVPTTPDPIDGVLAGIDAGGVDLNDLLLFKHGTTLATNALITRRFPPAVMITTKGFRDTIEIRRGNRDDLWDTYKEMAKPYIRRRDRLVVTERTDYAGKIVTPLDEAEAADLARIVKKRGVKTVAICFANAFVNPENERRMRDVIAREIPDATISISSDIMPEIFEHERFSTTVANAVLAPVVGGYAKRLEGRMKEGGYKEDVLLLHSGGGVMTAKMAENFAARLSASGIAAGAIASRFVAEQAGFKNSIGLDMGGTSTDVSLCDDGQLRVTKEWFVEYGYPICFPSIEVLTIGAGGGSLAWIDAAKSLRNGPQSAGSTPGPACYGRGGENPTNCDANVVLGRLSDELAGGKVSLDKALATEAIRKGVAEPMGMSIEDAALSILKVANANMADAVRLLSIRRGYDPRDFALVAFGGAGPLHGAALAKDLSIPVVLVPPNPGVTSALGCLLVDIQHDVTQMYLAKADDVDIAEVEQTFQALEREGRERLKMEGVTDDRMVFQRKIDMRYLGQWRALSISLSAPVTSLDEAIATFHHEHGREHNYSRPGAPVEIYRLSVIATGVTAKAKFAEFEPVDARPEPSGARMVRFDELPEAVETPVYDRTDLRAGMKVAGPAVIDQLDSTVIVPPGVTAEVDRFLTIVMRIPQA
ncbi:hydantoinase/oxoprolinase family protein [Hansschlegelia beijingensis]|uniref:N-methylhydantoinase A n=1 Tax=Hansschlegelia beijingensis TaxID=1133344 RepID=A0A7W6GD96_9HYPH|nr:hydantoinase/oxoprolinase family protein [Hansschlegelia beijingensis]MBB3971611.1 N-methylhydantoinase A [Hansschlegelia beijingensis]